MMKSLLSGCLMAVSICALAQNVVSSAPSVEIVKVKIDATEFDRRMLLDKLNANGHDHNLKFQIADQEYDYRMVFDVRQETALGNGGWGGIWGNGGTYNTSTASADVYDAKGNELFEFKRRLRATDYGATNAVAKEVIKRLELLKRGS